MKRPLLIGLVLAVMLSTMPLAALASPAAASANPPGNGQCVYHWVKPGETLSGIASRYGVNMWTIAQRNGISNPNRIYAGQQLLIYCTTPKPPPPRRIRGRRIPIHRPSLRSRTRRGHARLRDVARTCRLRPSLATAAARAASRRRTALARCGTRTPRYASNSAAQQQQSKASPAHSSGSTMGLWSPTTQTGPSTYSTTTEPGNSSRTRGRPAIRCTTQALSHPLAGASQSTASARFGETKTTFRKN